MTDIIIKKVNESFITVTCIDEGTVMDIHEHFSFLIKNHQFDPRVKSGKWNGIKHLYDKRTKKLPAGLLLDLLEFCVKRKYTYKVEKCLFEKESISIEDIKHIVQEVIKPHDNGALIEPYDYQYDTIHYALNMNSSISLVSTSGGKSLIIYLLLRIYQLLDEFADKKMLLVVPTKNLVEQMYNDFANYSTHTNQDWHVTAHVQKVNSDYIKTISTQIIVSTWHSATKFNRDFYEDLSVLIVDEVDQAVASVLSNIITNSDKTPIKHGLTGTMNDSRIDEMQLIGMFGPIKKIISAKQLIDSGRATQIQINMILLEHTQENRDKLKQKLSKVKVLERYAAEAEFLHDLKSREEMLFNLFKSAKGNTLVLFDKVENYGEPMYERFKLQYDKTHLIVGKIETEDRNEIKRELELSSGNIVFASFQTMSRGESIKNLHNVFIVSTTKSKPRVLQTIGRLMRLHASKKKANVYDIVDNLSLNGKMNYSYKHAFDRVNFYTKEKHKIEFLKHEMRA